MARGLFGNTGVPDPDLTNPPPTHRVGFTGRDPIGMKPRLFSAWLSDQVEQMDKRKENEKFERFLATSDMNPAERELARINHYNPKLGDIIERTRRNRQESADRKQMQEDRIAWDEEKRRADAEAKANTARLEADAEREWVEGAEGSAMPGQVPTAFAPNAPPTLETMFSRGVEGLTGMPATKAVPQMANVQRLHPAILAKLQKVAPQSPILQQAMAETEFQDIQARMQAQRVKEMEKRAEVVRKKQEEQKERMEGLDFLGTLWQEATKGAHGPLPDSMAKAVMAGEDPYKVWNNQFGKDDAERRKEERQNRDKKNAATEKKSKELEKSKLAEYTDEEYLKRLKEWEAKNKLGGTAPASLKVEARQAARRRIRSEAGADDGPVAEEQKMQAKFVQLPPMEEKSKQELIAALEEEMVQAERDGDVAELEQMKAIYAGLKRQE